MIRLYRRVRPDIVHHVRLKMVLFGGISARLTKRLGTGRSLADLGPGSCTLSPYGHSGMGDRRLGVWAGSNRRRDARRLPAGAEGSRGRGRVPFGPCRFAPFVKSLCSLKADATVGAILGTSPRRVLSSIPLQSTCRNVAAQRDVRSPLLHLAKRSQYEYHNSSRT